MGNSLANLVEENFYSASRVIFEKSINMSNFKLIADHQAAAERFISEVGSNAVRYYDINSFQSDIVPSVYPASYLAKCTSMTVAVSGTLSGLDWMVFCPHRVDRNTMHRTPSPRRA